VCVGLNVIFIFRKKKLLIKNADFFLHKYTGPVSTALEECGSGRPADTRVGPPETVREFDH
jgi:hypothetical protein